jgi:hypothetical protein
MSDYLVEYMNIHLISIEQDIEGLVSQMDMLDPESKDFKELDFEYNYLQGQAIITRHYLSVANDRMKA